MEFSSSFHDDDGARRSLGCLRPLVGPVHGDDVEAGVEFDELYDHEDHRTVDRPALRLELAASPLASVGNRNGSKTTKARGLSAEPALAGRHASPREIPSDSSLFDVQPARLDVALRPYQAGDPSK